MEKFCRAWQDTYDNIAQAHYKLRSSGHRHTLTICTTQHFSMLTTVARKLLNVTFTSIACLVVINITSVHMSLMVNSRAVQHIALIQPL